MYVIIFLIGKADFIKEKRKQKLHYLNSWRNSAPLPQTRSQIALVAQQASLCALSLHFLKQEENSTRENR